MNIVLRPGRPEDANACGSICYRAFKAISDEHNFPPDFPIVERAVGLMNYIFSDKEVYSVVAEADGKIVGSNFLWESTFIGGIGPITVDPNVQNSSVGRKLMEQVLQRAEERHLAGVRLVQAAYHNRALSLYTRLNFDVREPLTAIQGSIPPSRFPGYEVRPAAQADFHRCNELCIKVHGHDRSQELSDAIKHKIALVVESHGRVSGYTTGVGFYGHTVAETNNELIALIGASPSFAGPGFLLPSRNSEVLRWCLNNGLRIVQPMTLMSIGLYSEPNGAFLPSVLF